MITVEEERINPCAIVLKKVPYPLIEARIVEAIPATKRIKIPYRTNLRYF